MGAKLAVDTASKNIAVAHKALAEGEFCRKREGAELESNTRKKDRLESTKETVFAPLKDNMAKGNKGQKQIKVIRKVGKEFGFHDVLLDSIPAVLRKQPDRRQTFDGVALRSLSSEFSKHVDKLMTAAKENEVAFAEHLKAEQVAQENLGIAKEARSKGLANLSTAE